MKESPQNSSRRFPKAERLHSKKLMDALFSKGASFSFYPFAIKFLPNPDGKALAHQMLVSVSKRHFKKAVDRNLIKRRVREAYRLQRGEYLSQMSNNKYLLIAYIYIAKEIHTFDFIESKLIAAFGRLSSKLNRRKDESSGKGDL